jgi:hypothetical protein
VGAVLDARTATRSPAIACAHVGAVLDAGAALDGDRGTALDARAAPRSPAIISISWPCSAAAGIRAAAEAAFEPRRRGQPMLASLQSYPQEMSIDLDRLRLNRSALRLAPARGGRPEAQRG